MATAEHRLLTRIIQTGDLDDVLDYGVGADDFMNDQCRGIWLSVYGYYRSSSTRNSVIAPDAFSQRYPQFEFVESPGMTTLALCHDVRMARITQQVKDSALLAVSDSDVDPLHAASQLRKAMDNAISYGSNKSADVHFSSRISELLHTYELKESGMIQPIFRWPWLPLDEETGGVMDEDYVLLWGRPKSMKTFVLTYCMAEAFEQGLRVLCYTKEMTPDNMLLRTSAFLARLPYKETRLGRLGPQERQLLFMLDEYIKGQSQDTGGRNDLIVLSGRDADGHDGVVWLQSKIKQYKPDICFVDGLYLLNDDRGGKRVADWQRVMHISRDVRQMILDTRVPVVATMQANRHAAQNTEAALDEIAYSDSVGQDITQGFRVVNEADSPTIALIAGGSREYQLHGVRIQGIPCQDFSFKEIMSEREIEKVVRKDSAKDESNTKKAPAKAKRQPRTNGKSDTDKMLDEQLKDL